MTKSRPYLSLPCLVLALLPACGDDIIEAEDEIGDTSSTESSGESTTETSTTETSTSETSTTETSTETTETSTDTTTETTDTTTETTETTTEESTSEGPDPICGDGSIDPGEDCDDGNQIDDDECSNACVLNPFLIELSDPALALAIPDDGYVGTPVSMACANLEVQADASVLEVEAELAITHTFVGELTGKLISPAGTVITLFSRPGMVDLGDNGSGCCGESANLQAAGPLRFRDDFMADPESMGGPLGNNGVVCIDDGICEYTTNPGSAAAGSLLDLVGEGTAGFWRLCVGDSVGGDTGTLVGVGLTILAQ